MTIQTIDAATAKAWLDHGEALLIDVREPAEHAALRIDGARLAPLGGLDASAVTDAGARRIIVHCLRGGRGLSACEKLQRARPDLDLYNLDGGISAWSAAGLPTVASERGPSLPLDRQVQLTIGMGLLAASALTVLVHPAFIVLPLIFGTGLTVAGLTGFCGLARLMAAMPWNRA